MAALRRITIGFLLISHTSLPGQFNLQHHYDIGRRIFTSTAEFFFVDNLGSTFGFTDINYDSYHYSKQGATDMYYEVARYFKTPWINGNLSATLQYNDGVIFFPESDTTLFPAVHSAWLGGLSYYFPFKELTLSADVLARYEDGDRRLGYQLTFVWYYPFAKRFSVTGFFDVWNSQKDGTIIILSEPQVLYTSGKFAMGVEVEVSRNFPAAWTRKQEFKENKLFFIPTLFIKYTF